MAERNKELSKLSPNCLKTSSKRRWRKLAVWESWDNFKKFSFKEFLLDPENKLHYPERFSKVVYECQKRQISYEEFETLFTRCGKYLEELSLENFQIYGGICFTILPMVPALRHLHMAGLVESGVYCRN
uniref:Uncharacterized protein n=1 Tax=Ditylenchus dipsaci TaxID=166011 RepID=A0A915D707_9BILA